MGMLDEIVGAQGGNLIKQLAGSLGVSENDARSAAGKLLPALSRGMRNNVSQPDGLGALLGALRKGNHGRYVDHPELLDRKEAVDDGNAILGHLLGSKDVSRRVASQAAAETGMDAGILKKMLPMIAAMAMGTLSKQASSGGMPASLSGANAPAGLQGMLTSFLDADKDGSVLDDVMGMARKLF